MEYYVIARVVHVLAVVIWIGGVAMVTMVLIPAIKRFKSNDEKSDIFTRIESKFSTVAKHATLLTGISGFYMLYVMNAWDRYLDIRYWWVHGMTLLWLIFTLILFVLEPLVLHKIFQKYVKIDPVRTFKIMHTAHWILLILSLITMAGAVAGAHGWLI